ncbi:MAG: hypothetical protein ACHQ4H_16745, partial [Ktedonobacterales bacterium]
AQALPAVRVPPGEQSESWLTSYGPAVRPGNAEAPPHTNGANGGYADSGSRLPPMGDDSRELDAWSGGYSSEMAGFTDEQPISPTALGLPRLTSPDLQELPPSWQELVRGAPRQKRGEYVTSQRTPAAEASGEWSSVEAPAWSYRNDSVELAAHDGRRAIKNPNPRDAAGDDGSYWGDDQEWTNGAKAAKSSRPRRWVRPVVMIVLLLLVVNLGALVVLRPDLCPVAQCQVVSAKAHHYLPFLGAATATPAVISGQPAAIKLTAASGASASSTVVFNDVSAESVTWSATTGLSWVSAEPGRGSILAGKQTQFTLTAAAKGITPGAYATTLTLTVAGRTVRIPVSITVTAAGT